MEDTNENTAAKKVWQEPILKSLSIESTSGGASPDTQEWIGPDTSYKNS